MSDCARSPNMQSVNDSLFRRLELGPGVRVQRGLEASLLVAAILTTDARLVWPVLGMCALQVLWPPLAPAALLVAWLRPSPKTHRIGDMYHDFGGIRGACAVATLLLALGLWLQSAGYAVGWVLIACPAASCLLLPTVGFCAGCSCYVVAKDALSLGENGHRRPEGAEDVVFDSPTTSRR